mmetsp:Transcript_33356/g.78010  ORF Transcript_33356/g.78010 Transcript_33356/m.78010 type:complete len:104 (+) Transcript_33356:220-531(+)
MRPPGPKGLLLEAILWCSSPVTLRPTYGFPVALDSSGVLALRGHFAVLDPPMLRCSAEVEEATRWHENKAAGSQTTSSAVALKGTMVGLLCSVVTMCLCLPLR